MNECITRWLILISAALCVPGCISNIAGDIRYPTDYVVGAVYRFRQPVFACKADLSIFGTYSGLTLQLPGSSQMPMTVEEYAREPYEWSEIAGTIQPGSRVCVTKILLEKNPENGDMVWIEGQIMDIPWAKKPAELAFISRHKEDRSLLGDLPMVDTNILERLHESSPNGQPPAEQGPKASR